MSKVTFGYTNDFYPYRIFVSYLNNSSSQPPTQHPLVNSDEVVDKNFAAWTSVNSTNQIIDFFHFQEKNSKQEKETFYLAYQFPKLFGKTKFIGNVFIWTKNVDCNNGEASIDTLIKFKEMTSHKKKYVCIEEEGSKNIDPNFHTTEHKNVFIIDNDKKILGNQICCEYFIKFRNWW